MARALSRAGMRPPERFYLLYPHELSGGQRQRVVIAGALVLDPKVIVADEPVSNLDASVRGEILQLLLKLRDELQMSILIVTHDLGLAWTVADRVAVMYLGRIVEIGPAEEVLLRPRHPYTKALLDVVPEAGGIDRPILLGRAAGPDAGPAGLPVPSAVPGGRVGGGGEARHRREVPRGRSGARGARSRATSRPATRLGSTESPITSPRPAPSTRQGPSDARSIGSASGGRFAFLLRRLIAVALQHTEDRLHLGVGQSLVGVHARGTRGCKQGPEVGLGHLDPMLQLSSAFREAAGPPLCLGPHLPVLTGFLPGRLELGAEQGNLLTQLDQPIHGRTAQVRVRQAATTSGARILRPFPGASASSLDRLSFPIGDRGLVQEAVRASRRLQPAPRHQCPHCARDRQWIREAQFPAKLRRSGFQQFPLLCSLRDSGEECIDALEALLVHGRILPDCQVDAPVVRKHTE